MFFDLVGIGFILSLDNFRTSLTLGPLRFGWRRNLLAAVVFGAFDALAPLVGLLLADYLRQELAGPVSEIVGPSVIGCYGLYVIVQTIRAPGKGDQDYMWTILGLPAPLSLDNLVAGAGLGLAGLSPVVPAVLFGVITFIMSMVGLQIGQEIASRLKIRVQWEYVTGGALLLEALLLGLGVLD